MSCDPSAMPIEAVVLAVGAVLFGLWRRSAGKAKQERDRADRAEAATKEAAASAERERQVADKQRRAREEADAARREVDARADAARKHADEEATRTARELAETGSAADAVNRWLDEQKDRGW